MLRRTISDNGETVTVYSNKIAVGGITGADNGDWYWALFAIRMSNVDSSDGGEGLGGVEKDRESAFAALAYRWSSWISDAGLVYAKESLN